MSMTLVFWNVRNLFPVGQGARQPRTPQALTAKLDALARAIRRIVPNGLPDLLAVAEVADLSLLQTLVANLRPSVTPTIVFEAPRAGETGIGVAALTPAVTKLARVDADWGVHGRTTFRPRALSLDATTMVRGRSVDLRFVACHWKSDRNAGYSPVGDREASGRWLQAHTANRDLPVVVMGDMNAEPFARELQRGLKARRHYTGTKNGRLFNAVWPWLAEPDHLAAMLAPGYKLPRPRTTFGDGGSSKVLDQVLVSHAVLHGPPFRLDQGSVRCHVDADTAVTRKTGNVVPLVTTSDHFPLVAELRW